jgi:hypothetical protein
MVIECGIFGFPQRCIIPCHIPTWTKSSQITGIKRQRPMDGKTLSLLRREAPVGLECVAVEVWLRRILGLEHLPRTVPAIREGIETNQFVVEAHGCSFAARLRR